MPRIWYAEEKNAMAQCYGWDSYDDAIIDLYGLEELSFGKIASMFGVTGNAVQYRIISIHGITPRGKGGPNNTVYRKIFTAKVLVKENKNHFKNQYMNMKEVCVKLGVSKVTVFNWVRRGKFPKPLKLAPKCVRWESKDILNWCER